MVEFIVVLLVVAIVVIFYMVCIAAVIIAGIFIFKTAEKIARAIENFFDNL